MLFTVVPPDAKYKGKNVIDTAVYRGADAVSGWVKTGIDAVATNPAVVAVAGAMLALLWAFTGWSLARQQTALAADGETSAPGSRAVIPSGATNPATSAESSRSNGPLRIAWLATPPK